MKLNWRVLVGVVMVVFGVVGLLQATNLVKFEGNVWLWVFAAFFALLGVGFLYILVTDRVKNWWAAIPGCTLLGLGTLMMLEGLPGDLGELPPAIFLSSIGVSFIVVFLLDRSRWWAVIPGGTLVSLGAMLLLQDVLKGNWTPTILFLGMAITFAVLALLDRQKLKWAWFPAAGLAALALFIPSVEGSMPWIIWPLALIIVGVYLVGRSLLKK